MFLEHHLSSMLKVKRFESQIIFFNFGSKKSEMLKQIGHPPMAEGGER